MKERTIKQPSAGQAVEPRSKGASRKDHEVGRREATIEARQPARRHHEAARRKATIGAGR